MRRPARRWFEVCAGLVAVIILVGWWNMTRTISLVNAARAGDLTAVRAQLDRGTNVDARWKGLTALQFAVFEDHADVVRLLLDRGANPTPALHQAIVAQRPDMVRLLLQRGADPDWKCPDCWQTPREMAATYRLTEIEAMLGKPRRDSLRHQP